MKKLNQFHVSYVLAKRDNGVIFGDKIVEINDNDTTIDGIRRQLAKDMKDTSPNISWDEATILNFRPMEEFFEKSAYFHISYMCLSPGLNNPTFGDSIIHLAGDDVCLGNIHGWLIHMLSEYKPDVKWNKPIIIDLQPLPEDLALQLDPALKDQK